MNTTLQTRIDAKLKKEAKRTLEAMGLDLSTGIKLFLTQVVRTQSIPFELFTYDNLSEEEKLKLVAETEEAITTGKRYATVQELHEDLLSEK